MFKRTIFFAPEDGGQGGAPAAAPLAESRGNVAASPHGTSADPFAGERSAQPAAMPGAPDLGAVKALQADPDFMRTLMHHDPRVRAPALERWAAAHAAQAGLENAENPYKTTAIANDGDLLEAQIGPKAASEYAFSPPPGLELDPNIGAWQQEVFQAGVAPQIANQLWRDAPRVEAMDNAAWSSQIANARSMVMAMPGGAQTIQDAAKMTAKLEAKGPLWARAVNVAVTTPSGILELARLARRAART